MSKNFVMDGNVLFCDGFQIVAEYACEVSKMVSNLEAAYMADRRSKFEVLELFGDYLDGRKDENDVNEILYTEWPEAFPGLTREQD